MIMNAPTISIIIPAYNAKNTISSCLTAVLHQTISKERYEVIVVDDSSTDNTKEIVQSFPDIKCITISHGGPALARNAGAKAAIGELLAFTDADCAPNPDWLEKMTEQFVDSSIMGVKGTYKTNQDNLVARFVQIEYEYKYERMAHLHSIDFIDTYAAAYRNVIFQKNGGFKPLFTVPSVEDQEFSFRLARKGYRLVFKRDATVNHIHDETIKQYFLRKKNIGFWKAIMLNWLPEKALSDSHTSPSQRWQILFLGLTILSIPFAFFLQGMLIFTLITIFLFFMTGLRLVFFSLKRDIQVGFITPIFLIIRAIALGLGLIEGFLSPRDFRLPQKRNIPLFSYYLKRLLDLIVAAIGLIISSPIILLACVAVYLDSGGPVFFLQERVGQNGKLFKIIKLRTMVVGAEEQLNDVIHLNQLKGPVYKILRDPRVTSIGRILRRWSIDEMPQFINVIVGDMSLVGPRPEETWVVEKYDDFQRRRLEVKPGLTGPMQINGRGRLDMDDRIKIEIDYIECYSFWKDVEIILRTIPVIFSGDGAF